METSPQIVSVNVAGAAELDLGQGPERTGIFKEPRGGPVRVTRAGVAGDVVADLEHHGGVDQAVYLYSVEEYAWWEASLGRSFAPGAFGENLTVTGLPAALRVGDRLRVGGAGGVLLEVTAPRIPCSKLSVKMDDLTFVKRFAAANRPGAYARVLEEGVVSAGDPVEHVAAPGGHPTVGELFGLWFGAERDPAFLRRALEAPLAERTRRSLERWLAGS